MRNNVYESEESIKTFKKFVAAKFIKIFVCACWHLYLIAKSITHTENVIINADDLLCLQLHAMGQVHPTFYWDAAKFGKIWPARRQHELSTQNEERLSLSL